MQTANALNLKKTHIGILQSLMQEFEQHRLPRLLRLKDKVDSGQAVNVVDLEFLCKQLKDANLTMHLTTNYPELQEFCMVMAHLYKEICEEALENEGS